MPRPDGKEWEFLGVSRVSWQSEPQDIHGRGTLLDLKSAQLPHAGKPSVGPHHELSTNFPPSRIAALEPDSPNQSVFLNNRLHIGAHLHMKISKLSGLAADEVEEICLRD